MKSVAICMAVVLLSGCANQKYGAKWEPLVDLRTPDQQSRYPSDLRECQAYAEKVMSAGQAAVAGALLGALLGAALGAAAGVRQRDVAGVGAVSGAAGAAGGAETNQRAIITRCLFGRGYNVLN